MQVLSPFSTLRGEKVWDEGEGVRLINPHPNPLPLMGEGEIKRAFRLN